MSEYLFFHNPSKGDILLAECGFRLDYIENYLCKDPLKKQYVFIRSQGESIDISPQEIKVSILVKGSPEDVITFDPSQDAISLHNKYDKNWYSPKELIAILEKAKELATTIT